MGMTRHYMRMCRNSRTGFPFSVCPRGRKRAAIEAATCIGGCAALQRKGRWTRRRNIRCQLQLRLRLCAAGGRWERKLVAAEALASPMAALGEALRAPSM